MRERPYKRAGEDSNSVPSVIGDSRSAIVKV